ncbi:MAG: hypothetical protein LUG61_00420 [Lachnospiraceae bacterium]|nr:hypothetical protein [Lachnospiraceae bacterium]
MGYRVRKISFEEAKTQAGQYSYMLAHMMSEVLFGKTSLDTFRWEELLDARFFSTDEELHVFKCEKEWRAVIVTDDAEQEDVLTLTYAVAGKYRGAGKELSVRQYLAADEDGQPYVELTRLCGIA